MPRRYTIFTRGLFGVAAALTALTLAASACSSSGTPGGGANTTDGTATRQRSSGAVIGTSSGAGGTHLTGSAGRAVYLWQADTSTTSTCTGSCAAVWPPVTTHGHPRATGGARATLLGTTKRPDGTLQVTYAGHPLYLYAADTGTATGGQGLDTFGALWWLVDASGQAITTSPGTSSGSGATSTPAGNGPYGY
jgi:predicted lipoprotein with Yx(FWY)xxD motif